MKYQYFVILGLQRTGTNWIHANLVKNLSGKWGNQKLDVWKHLTPLGGNRQEWPNRTEMLVDRLNLRDDVFYVATQKPFDMWETSVNRFGGNYYFTHNHSQDTSDQTPPTKKLAKIEIWNAWEQWKDKQLGKPNFYYHTYMDWLQNWQTYFEEIQEITGWERLTEEWENVPKVSNSPNFDITRYINDG